MKPNDQGDLPRTFNMFFKIASTSRDLLTMFSVKPYIMFSVKPYITKITKVFFSDFESEVRLKCSLFANDQPFNFSSKVLVS